MALNMGPLPVTMNLQFGGGFTPKSTSAVQVRRVPFPPRSHVATNSPR